MQKEYPELEGKEIDHIDEDGHIIKAVITGCSYDIGLTIQARDDKDHYLTCYMGPSSPNWTAYPNAILEYKASFYSAVNKIKKGFYDVRLSDKISKAVGLSTGAGASAETCPFSQ